MREYHAGEIGNVVVLGHAGCGKTSVIEAMAYRSGIITKIGKVEDGNTISDYNPEEIERKASIWSSIIPLEWNNCKINLLDTPGSLDFIGEVKQAVRVADSALIVVSGTRGIAVGTHLAWKEAQHLPKLIYINGVDEQNISFANKIIELKETFGKVIAPIQVPIIENGKMVGYVNVAKMEGRVFNGKQTEIVPIPEHMIEQINPIREMILEAVALTDDGLLNKYMNGEEFTRDEISWALRKGVLSNEIVPVLCGTKDIGIQIILNSIVAFFPAAADEVNSFIVKNVKTNEEEIIGYNETLDPSIFVFKTIVDPFTGRTSLFKVNTGIITKGMKLYNTKKSQTEILNKLFIVRGKKFIEVETLYAGDIGAVSKLIYTETNDTLCSENNDWIYNDIEFPNSNYTRAIISNKKANEEKISNAINKMLDSDKTLKFEINNETKQSLLSGIGDQHLDVNIDKIKNVFGVDIKLAEIKIPYRETILGKVNSRGKYKKQSGGHGQYGDVHIEFSSSKDLTKPYVFEEKIVGGAVPKNYFPAVEKGLQEACNEGVLIGAPMVGLKAVLFDGTYHPVDSSELAFKMAAQIAYKDGIGKANPVILEPCYNMQIIVPEIYTGDVMSDLNKRRAKVIGMENHTDNNTKIDIQVPLATIINYTLDLRAITQGRGSYSMSFASYEQVPSDLQTIIIKENEKNK